MNTFKTYVISLRKDIERRDWMNSIKNRIGLNFEFFNAIESESISDDIKNRYFSKTDFHLWDINQSAVMATFMSHVSLLRYSNETKTNLLILEDDIDIVNSYNWDNVDFSEFDLYNVGTDLSCYSYFVSYEGAMKILNHFDKFDITQAYDWELKKINDLNTKLIQSPLFIQTNKFASNIAPNGYNLKCTQ
jgi:GR25 family glycosyltransferase involved in LPS biosynthesis